MKFLIVTMGPGETAQGAAFGKYLIQKGEEVSFIVLKKETLKFLDNFDQQKQFTESPDDVKNEIESQKYDCVVLCNSKMFHSFPDFQEKNPQNKPLVVSIDSNWLFNQPEKFPYVKWLDKIFINLPEDVYEYGLVENGGTYFIPEEIKRKITTIGLLPSYPKLSSEKIKTIRNGLNIRKDQKLVFCYIGSSVTFKSVFHERLLAILDQLYLKHKDIMVIYLSGQEPNKEWLIKTGGQVSSQRFYELLSASDVVLQHQGLGTLEQAISAQVPVVANVVNPSPDEKIHTHAWEVGPFEKAGMCKMHYFNDSQELVIKSLGDLLYTSAKEKMIQSQEKDFSRGEEKLYEEIKLMLSNRSL